MKHFALILVSTFVVGVFSGVYVYFISRSTDPVFNFGDNDTARGFDIIADAYGGCQRLGECPSFRITDEGTYRYLIPRRNTPGEEYEGTMSDREFEVLKDALRTAPLEEAEVSDASGACPASFDGVAYQYDIRIGDRRYVIDTCENATHSITLFTLLESYFAEFARKHSR